MTFYTKQGIVLFQKISIPPHTEGFIKLNSCHPSGNYILVLYFCSKIRLLNPPPPLEFSLTVLGVGMDIFWNYTICENSV